MPNEWNVTLDEKGRLCGDQAYKLFREGVEAWNAFMEQHPDTNVDFRKFDFSQYQDLGEADFSNFQFPKGVSFAEANFGNDGVYFDFAVFGDGGTRFNKTSFGNGKVSFFNASFGDSEVSFKQALFGNNEVLFNNSSFGSGNVSFLNAIFGDGDALFEDISFGDGKVSFYGASFGNGKISFIQTKFGGGKASFFNAKFGDGYLFFNDIQCESLDFTNASFNENSKKSSSIEFSMERATISKSLLLPNLDFRGFDSVSLRGTVIGTLFDIEGSRFAQLPDLTATTINGHFSVDRIHVDTPKSFTEGDSTKARRLKELAKKAEDRRTELDMLALELDAMTATKQIPPLSCLLNKSYKWVSDYGRSIYRPAGLLLLVFSVCACLYFGLSKKESNAWHDAIQLSASQSLPFLSLSRTVAGSSLTALYGTEEAQQETATKKQKPSYYNAVEWIGLLQNLLSYICLFFIGLGIRNRFKL